MTDRLSTTFKVGRRHRCTILLPLPMLKAGALQIEPNWEPVIPRRLTKAELRDYRRGRDALLKEAARHLGGPVAVLEL
jgi:hypothetical protein